MDTIIIAVISLIALIGIGGLAMVGIGMKKKRISEWKKFASCEGLEYDGKSINGKYRGFDFKLYDYIEGTDDYAVLISDITITLPFYTDYNISISYDSLPVLGKLPFFKDLEIGDKVFDETFVVKGEIPENIDTILTSDIRQELVNHPETVRELIISHNMVKYKIRPIPATFSRYPVDSSSGLKYISDIVWQIAKNITDINMKK